MKVIEETTKLEEAVPLMVEGMKETAWRKGGGAGRQEVEVEE